MPKEQREAFLGDARAVSYTHLDVYKRQVGSNGNWLGVSKWPLVLYGSVGSNGNWLGVSTVSYTHLDVYKRQV